MIPSNRPIERTVTPDVAPVAGGEFTLRPNKGGGWLIKSLRFILETSAAVANRTVGLEVSHSGNIYLTTAGIEVVPENELGVFCAFGGGQTILTNAAYIPIAWPTDGLWLPQGHELTSVTFNGDVADQFSLVVARVIEYPSGSERELWPYGPGVALPPELT